MGFQCKINICVTEKPSFVSTQPIFSTQQPKLTPKWPKQGKWLQFKLLWGKWVIERWWLEIDFSLPQPPTLDCSLGTFFSLLRGLRSQMSKPPVKCLQSTCCSNRKPFNRWPNWLSVFLYGRGCFLPFKEEHSGCALFAVPA